MATCWHGRSRRRPLQTASVLSHACQRARSFLGMCVAICGTHVLMHAGVACLEAAADHRMQHGRACSELGASCAYQLGVALLSHRLCSCGHQFAVWSTACRARWKKRCAYRSDLHCIVNINNDLPLSASLGCSIKRLHHCTLPSLFAAPCMKHVPSRVLFLPISTRHANRLYIHIEGQVAACVQYLSY